MSHVMRTSLLEVLSFLDLALQTSLNAEQLDFLQCAQSSGKLLMVTLDSVLDQVKASADVSANGAAKDSWVGTAASADLTIVFVAVCTISFNSGGFGYKSARDADLALRCAIVT